MKKDNLDDRIKSSVEPGITKDYSETLSLNPGATCLYPAEFQNCFTIDACVPPVFPLFE